VGIAKCIFIAYWLTVLLPNVKSTSRKKQSNLRIQGGYW
jgi:hypothetical protein